MKDVKDTSADRPGDLPEDERLRLALRHAPDAELGAPPHLSAQIVAAGYRAAAEPALAPSTAAGALRRPWRLGASGAFASVALAGVIGLMWRGETPPAVAPREEPAAAAQAPASQDKRTELLEPAATLQTQASKPAGRAVETRTRREAVSSDKSHASTERAAAQVAAREASPTPARPAAPAAPEAEHRLATAPASGDGPTPPAAPTLADRPHAAPPADASLSLEAKAAAAQAEAAAPHRPRAFRPAPAAEPLGMAAAPERRMRASPRVEAPWTAALAEGKAVQWWVQGQTREAPSGWLMAVAAQASGRWQASSPTPGKEEATVEWRRGDVLLGRLWLNDERVLWCSPAADCEQAPLASEVAATLRRTLPR